MNSYFSHDSNARNDAKLIKVRSQYGAAGYGVYFMLLERLRDEDNYMSIKDYNMLAFDLRVDTSIIKAVVENFGLFVFTDDGKYFYSEGFKKRMVLKDAKTKKLSKAGKKGANKRWNGVDIATPSKKDSHAISKPSKNMASKVKESKVKKSKVNHHHADTSVAKKDDDVKKQMDLSQFYQDNFGVLSPLIDQKLSYRLDDFDGNAEMVKAAMERAVMRQASFNYADKIMSNWLKNGIKTIADVEAAEKEFERKHSNPKYAKRKQTKGIIPSWFDEDSKTQAKPKADSDQDDDSYASAKQKLERLEKAREKAKKEQKKEIRS